MVRLLYLSEKYVIELVYLTEDNITSMLQIAQMMCDDRIGNYIFRMITQVQERILDTFLMKRFEKFKKLSFKERKPDSVLKYFIFYLE